jgi:peroxiredoxin
VASRTNSSDEKSPLTPIAHLAFVLAAALGVYSFVSVAKEGETRRRCSATCLLRPTYAGFEKKTCGPCMEEMPEIADLARILKPMNDVAVVTVSTDDTAQDATDALKSVLKEEAPFPVLMDPDAKNVSGKYGTSLYPETWIIDKEGVIRARFDGAREWSNAAVVQLVEQIRTGGYCEVQARDGKFVGKDAPICDSINGG